MYGAGERRKGALRDEARVQTPIGSIYVSLLPINEQNIIVFRLSTSIRQQKCYLRCQFCPNYKHVVNFPAVA